MIRPITYADLPALKSIIRSNALFPEDMLDEMTAQFLADPAGGAHYWLLYDSGAGPTAVGYYIPEYLTDGTYNLLLIAVAEGKQGGGLGTAVLEGVERHLRSVGGRVLIVETSSLPGFARARRFYQKAGFTHEATIRAFYAEGEDKVVFWKNLRADVSA